MILLYQMVGKKMGRYELEWRIDQCDAGKEMKLFLREQGVSRKALSAIKFSGGTINVNGKEETVRYILQKSDSVKVIFPSEEINDRLIGEDIPLSILYEDDDLLIIDKPPYMSTIPSRDHPSGSVANALKYYYEQIGLKSSIHIVTRLDRDTSGLVLVAKHRHSHHLLSLMQRRHEIHRFYEGFAEGDFDQEQGVIDAPIGRKPGSIIEREVREDGQFALTKYQVLHQYPTFAHLKWKLETGRTHQIRVHMSSLEHPLLGDDLYGGRRDKIKRQALHCQQIMFKHPLSGQDLNFQIALPTDMTNLFNSL
ncbi:RluA family pseudouridine synthase [Bacillus niameyensis]|uniref:RluA family pseudouridine synthase n=1 Tax=Bacillus niameyensis TaxID=1522308 RepID=UPI000AC45D39|nr:RluA family pseudouridine synthase [Bacillus niameyensis]